MNIGGDRMTDEIDQEALMDILERTERDHARPYESCEAADERSLGMVSRRIRINNLVNSHQLIRRYSTSGSRQHLQMI